MSYPSSIVRDRARLDGDLLRRRVCPSSLDRLRLDACSRRPGARRRTCRRPRSSPAGSGPRPLSGSRSRRRRPGAARRPGPAGSSRPGRPDRRSPCPPIPVRPRPRAAGHAASGTAAPASDTSETAAIRCDGVDPPVLVDAAGLAIAPADPHVDHERPDARRRCDLVPARLADGGRVARRDPREPRFVGDDAQDGLARGRDGRRRRDRGRRSATTRARSRRSRR